MNMDNFADERDQQILLADKYTFAVLRRIIKDDCRVRLTDHERLILVHTGFPFPVWVWLPDDASEEEKERAWQLVKKECPPENGFRYNVKYDFAEYMMRRASEEGRKIVIETNMFAYDCPSPVPPHKPTDGSLYIGTMDELDLLVDLMVSFHDELDIDKQTRDQYRDGARYILEHRQMYFWKNDKGEITACCKYAPDGDLATINLVYTFPEHRRKHYAEHVVYAASKQAVDDGLLPMLYTDADYVASNSCYEKVGYVLRGKLCTVKMVNDVKE